MNTNDGRPHYDSFAATEYNDFPEACQCEACEQSIKQHVERFTLVSDREEWLKRYYEIINDSRDDTYENTPKGYSMLYATFYALSKTNQLIIKEVEEVSESGDKQYTQEIHVLDQQRQVVEIMKVVVNGGFTPNGIDLMLICNAESFCPKYKRYIDRRTILTVPLELPNRPEFQDDLGRPFVQLPDSRVNLRIRDNRYYTFNILIDKDCVSKEVINKK